MAAHPRAAPSHPPSPWQEWHPSPSRDIKPPPQMACKIVGQGMHDAAVKSWRREAIPWLEGTEISKLSYHFHGCSAALKHAFTSIPVVSSVTTSLNIDYEVLSTVEMLSGSYSVRSSPRSCRHAERLDRALSQTLTARFSTLRSTWRFSPSSGEYRDRNCHRRSAGG